MPATMSLYSAAITADRRWSAELSRLFGKQAGDVRYTKRGEGEPGTELNAAYREFTRTSAEWRDSLRGWTEIDTSTD